MKNRFKKALFFALILFFNHTMADTLRDFSSDGCSQFPEGTLENSRLWCVCCVIHDKAYWQGGTRLQKEIADNALRECILQKTASLLLADAMYYAVMIGGSAFFPTDYRWGYGWDYGRDYQPLKFDERQQVKHKLALYQQESVKKNECPIKAFELPLLFHKLW